MPYPVPRPPKYKSSVRRGVSGLGLFAEEDIPKGKFVIEYWGNIIPDDKVDEVGGRYLFEIGNGKTINGANRKNTARYINHACKPNCEMRTSGDRIYIFAIKNIKAGQELTYDYGKEYWDYFIKPHGCKCATCIKKRGHVASKSKN